ncbi:MAG: hypothetical protein JXB49_31580 [Bacteroidales bacterium]|nr:hypothetical protein [Bacteroidales bacterium]
MLNLLLLKERKWVPGLDQLWLIILLAGSLFFTSLVPLPPNDFWWHLKVGEIIVTTGDIPTTNMFGWTIDAHHPFTYGAWLGEALLYVLHRWGKLELIVFVRNLLQGLALYLVACEAKRRSQSWRLASLVVLLGFVMTINNLIVRPQMWSWVPFTIYLLVLNRYADNQIHKKWLLLCPILMVFWVNTHGAFVLGFVLLGIFFTSEVLRQLLSNTRDRDWQKTKWLTIISLMTFFAMMVNPKGPCIIGYVFNLMTDQPSQQHIIEWQSPIPVGIPNTVFYICILIFLVVFWFNRTRPKVEDILLFISFLWLAWSGMRYVVWFSLATMPLLAEQIIFLLDDKGLLLQRKGRRNLLNVMIMLLVFVPVLLVQPWFVESVSLPLPASYWNLVLVNEEEGSLLAVETPIGAAKYLRTHPGRKIYNEMGYGSYFIWALPEMGVFIDTRVELYPYELWQDYGKIQNGIRYNTLLEKYDVDRIVLDLKLQENLAESLVEDPLWERVYDDGRAQIWDRY